MKYKLSNQLHCFILLEQSTGVDDDLYDPSEDVQANKEKEVIDATKKDVSEAQKDVYENDGVPAWIHETILSDADVGKRLGKRFYGLQKKADKNWAKQASYENKKRDIILNNNDINPIEKDKFDIVFDYIKDELKWQLWYLKDEYGRRGAKKIRMQAYEALTYKFLRENRESDAWYNPSTNNVSEIAFTLGTDLKNVDPLQFNYQTHKKLFDKLKQKDDKLYSLFDEAVKKEESYTKAKEDGVVERSELSSDYTRKERRKVARFDKKQDKRAEKSLEIDEQVNEKYKLYTWEIADALQGTTSVDVYTNKWKKLERKGEIVRNLTDFDRICIVACDYNMDGDVTPKPLKEQFAREKWLWRRLLWETRANRYNRKSKWEKPLTISASQLRETMRIAKAEVGEAELVQNVVNIINTNLFVDTEHEKMPAKLPNTIKTSDELFGAISENYHYVRAFREGLANFPANVTDLLTIGSFKFDKDDQNRDLYTEETQRLIAFDPLKQEKIAWELAQLQLKDVIDVWESMKKDRTTSEIAALEDFHKQVTVEADHQRIVMLQNLQEIKASGQVTNPTELQELDAQIAQLENASVAVPHLTLQWLMAFMLFNYQWLSYRPNITKDGNGNVTSANVEAWYHNDKWERIKVSEENSTLNPDGSYTTEKDGKDNLKHKLARTSLNAFWIGTGGSLVNFKTAGRYASNISRWANALSFLGADPKAKKKDIDNLNALGLDQNSQDYKDQLQKINEKTYDKRHFWASINVGYNGSQGLGNQIGNTQYYPVTLWFGLGASESYNTLAWFSTGLYAYAGPGRMRNAGKLQQTLDAKSSKESWITWTVGLDLKSNTRWANAQFNIIKKDYVKWYEIVADSIRNNAPQAILNILRQLQSDATPDKKGKSLPITPERLKAAVRNYLTADGAFDRNKRNSVMVDRMSTRLYSVMRTLYPGIETGDAKVITDLDKPEIAQWVANNLAFNLSLNWLNENYDKLKGLKWTGLSIDAGTMLMILAGASIPVVGRWALASFAFTNLDRYKKSNIQEEDATGKRNSDVMKSYNIWARKLKGDFVDHVSHVNEKVSILCNYDENTDSDKTPLISDYIVDGKKTGQVWISNRLLGYASTVPVYLNPIYGPQWDKAWYFKSVAESEKEHGGLLVPGHLAAGIMTNIGKTKDGALYIWYEATDKNMFQSEVDGEPRSQKAMLWTGQKFDGHPENFKATSEWYEKADFDLLWNDPNKFAKLREEFDVKFIWNNKVSLQRKPGDLQTKAGVTLYEIDMSKKDLVFNSTVDENWKYDISFDDKLLDRTDPSKKFQIIHNITTTKKWVDTESDESKELTLNYTVNKSFGVDPNKNRWRIKSIAEYKELSHELDKAWNTDWDKAAKLATSVINKYKAKYSDQSFPAHTFSPDKKEEIIRFMHELIGSSYCSVDNRLVTVWGGKWFAGLMSERTNGFKERWKNDATTSKVPMNQMEEARNSSLESMFNETSLGLTLDNYMDIKEHWATKYSFADQYAKSPSNPDGHNIIAWVIYGYNGIDGAKKTHDEKLALSPDIVLWSDKAITSEKMRAYTMQQVVDRYDAVYGSGAFTKEIGKQIGFDWISAQDLANIMNGSSTSVEINWWTLDISPQFFFYTECFNEGVGIWIKYNKKTKTPGSPSSTTTSESWPLDTYTSTGATWMFVNNITIGMTTEKRSIKWAVGVGLQVLPTSGTKISSEELLKSSTETSSTDLSEFPANFIADWRIGVTLENGSTINITYSNLEDASSGYSFEGPDGTQYVNKSISEFAEIFKGLLTQADYDALKATPGPTPSPEPQATSFTRIGSNGNSTEDMTNMNATSSLQDPNTTNRNPTQQRNRKWRSRPI
jgi:hypothetical protein